MHCINIVFSSKFGGVGWGTLSPDDVPASDPAYDNTNQHDITNTIYSSLLSAAPVLTIERSGGEGSRQGGGVNSFDFTLQCE